MIPSLKTFWGEIPQRGMPTGTIVEALDVSKNVSFGFCPGKVVLKMDLNINTRNA